MNFRNHKYKSCELKAYINLFKNIWFFSLTISALLVSCTDSVKEETIEYDIEQKSQVILQISTDDAMKAFATVGNSSRAAIEDEEGNLSNLYVVAVKVADYKNNTFVNVTGDPVLLVTELNPLGHTYLPGDDASKQNYIIDLYPGKYKFYVLANFDLYLSRFGKVSDFTRLSDFESINLNFSYNLPLEPGHLPLAAKPSNIVSNKDYVIESNGDVIITIQDKSKQNNYTAPTLSATMYFQCSKVRYTILYDNTENGISKKFGNKYSIRFNVDHNQYTVASNLRKRTYLLGVPDNLSDNDREAYYGIMTQEDNYQAFPGGETQEMNQAYWSIELKRYIFKDLNSDNNRLNDFNENYPLSPSDDSLEAWTGTTEDWMQQKQRVWQGVCYLPENNDNEIERSLLAFPYKIDTANEEGRFIDDNTWDPSKFKMIYLFNNDSKESHYPGSPISNGSSGNYPEASDDGNYGGQESGTTSHGLVRGMMYDVVAFVKTPDVTDLDVTVYVSVKPWEYEDIEQKW